MCKYLTTVRQVVLGLFALLVAATVFSSTASAQPDWCSRNNLNDAEAAICDTPQLWTDDSVLTTAYHRARSDSYSQRNYIRKKQRAWLKRRNACGYDVGCISWRYGQQIGWLEGYFNN